MYSYLSMAGLTAADAPLSPSEMMYRERVALERENRLNKEELRVYEDTKVELEFGDGFFQRAHP